MGIDLAKIFGDAQESAGAGMTDALKAGANAGLGYLEQQAVAVIQADQKDKQQQVQKYVQDQLSQPPNPGSFGSYLSGMMQQPVIKQYGVYILGGIGLIVLLTLFLKER